MRAPKTMSTEEPMAGSATMNTSKIATPRCFRNERPDGNRYAAWKPSMSVIIAPDAAQVESSGAVKISQPDRWFWAVNCDRTRSSVPGGITWNSSFEKTRATALAFTLANIAANDASTGKNANRDEYAAPLATPKQLSSYAAMLAWWNKPQKRCTGPGRSR